MQGISNTPSLESASPGSRPPRPHKSRRCPRICAPQTATRAAGSSQRPAPAPSSNLTTSLNPQHTRGRGARRRPAPSDLSPDITLITAEEISKKINEPESDRERKEQLARSRKVQLRAWLANKARVKNYFHDIDALATVTPVTRRFDGFREIIREVIEASARDSGRANE